MNKIFWIKENSSKKKWMKENLKIFGILRLHIFETKLYKFLYVNLSIWLTSSGWTNKYISKPADGSHDDMYRVGWYSNKNSFYPPI